MDDREVEWHFDAADLRTVERWLRARAEGGHTDHAEGAQQGSPSAAGERLTLAEAEAVTQEDTYVDTPDWRIHLAGYSLRLRRRRGAVEASLKSFGPPTEGLRRRREFSETLPVDDLGELRRSEGPVGERVRAMTGRANLALLFEVRTRRRAFDLSLDGAPVGEVTLDETTLPVGDGSRPARMKRVEVEVREPFVEELTEFVQAMRDECGLRGATVTKYEAGLLSRGLTPDQRLDLGSTVIDPSLSVGEVAFAVLRRHFQAFVAKEPGTRLGEDPEELHDMRVASRRLRAAILLFREALPVRAAGLRDELAWVAQALGAVRDLDVQLGQLEAWSDPDFTDDPQALEALRDLLGRERADARNELLKVLDSARYARLLDRWIGFLRAGPLRRSAPSRAPILVVGPELVGKRYRAFRKAGKRIGEGATPADYHRLRIRGKRLRYAVEFLADVYGGEAQPVIRRLVALQDLLGAQQDADVAVERLKALATGEGGTLPPRAVFAMGMVAERYAQQARRLRTLFPKVYGKVRGKPWKKLRVIMKERAG